MLRTVSEDEWIVGTSLFHRAKRLLNPPSPEELLKRVVTEWDRAVQSGTVHLDWEAASERPGFGRTVGELPLSEATFDQLFNGRSGYRAQYYLSPEEGLLFNRKILDAIEALVYEAYRFRPPRVGFDLIIHSLRMPHAKIWIVGEQSAFDEAEEGGLQPCRWWSHEGAKRGCRAPLPAHLKIDLKGSFVDPETGSFWVDKPKQDRACDLYARGFS